jgi:hypothetical protein
MLFHQVKRDAFKEKDLKASLAVLLKLYFSKDELKKEREAIIL